MRRAAIGLAMALVALVGCAPLRTPSSGAAPNGPPATIPQASGTAARPAAPPAESQNRSTAPPAQVQQPSTVGSPAPSSGTALVTPSPGRPTGPGAGQAAPPSAKPSAKPPTSAGQRTTPPAAKEPLVASAVEKTLTPPALDLAALEQSLRNTHAIGVFTKLSLKNEVDDLLDQFRAFHRGQAETPLAQLRQRYDLLLLKLLTLLQDSDPRLAAAIKSSREAIWAILTDPVKFAKL